jgi:tetratricopeptide (TPR) repeat protein
VKKQQSILVASGLLLLTLLLVFGKIDTQKQAPVAATEHAGHDDEPPFSITAYETSSKQKLSPTQSALVAAIENSVSRGAVKDQQVKAYQQLAQFWRDSVHNHELYVFYLSKASKLVNSEKNLTFAARQILEELRREEEAELRGWKAEQAIELYNAAINLAPDNDSLKVEMASCYVFGKGMAGDPQQTMAGIQQLLQVVKRDSMNMQAQLVLGIGGVVSTQYDKAITRLQTVLKNEPGNFEAMSWLADAYAAKGDKANAIKWYEVLKRLVNKPVFSKEVDERIKALK